MPQDIETREITVTYGRTYNVGKFESLRIDVTEKMAITGTKKQIRAAEKELYLELRARVENELEK